MPRTLKPSALRSAGRPRKLLVAVVLVLLSAAGAGYAVAQAVKPGITLQISPTSQSVTRGASAGFTITATSVGGFTGTVGFGVSGLPSGASAGFSPSSVTLASGGSASSTMTVSTTSSTAIGSYTLTVSGTSGKMSGTVTAGLTVNYPLSGTLSMSVTPSSVTISAGSAAVYSLSLARTNIPGPVSFSISSGLPTGATAAFSPNPTSGNSATLQINTAATVTSGTYTLYLVASGQDSSGKTQYAYASVTLVVSSGSSKQFTMSGNLAGLLAPSVSLPLDLTMANPNQTTLSVTNLTVTVQSVTQAAGAKGPCTTADYAVTQYSGPYPLTVPAGGSASLSGLAVPVAQRPHVRMLDTTSNQDGCKGASVTLAYSGSGQGS